MLKPRRRRSDSGGAPGGGQGAENTGSTSGEQLAMRVKVAGGIPHFRAVPASDMTQGMLAAWQPNDPQHAEGVVLINVEHPVLVAEIEHWQAQYPDHVADEIATDVIETYGEIAVAKVAHSEHLKGILPSRTVDTDLRSEAALTMALLELIGEEAVIAPRIGGKFKKRRAVA